MDKDGTVSLSSQTLEAQSVMFVIDGVEYTLSEYDLRSERSGLNGSEVFSLDAEIAVSTATESFSFSMATKEEVEFLAGQDNPSSGIMTILTPEGVRGRLEVLGDLVRVSEDADGDDVFEQVDDYTWVQLEAEGL